MGIYALLFLSLGIILLGAEGFTNSIEWLGKRLNLGAGAVGSILAAVGTALPETMVPIIAFISGGREGKLTSEVGIGAILGAPFMLATLAFFISGLAALIFRKNNRPLALDKKILKRDLIFFLLVYGLAVFTSFLPSRELKSLSAFVLFISYIWYVIRTVRSSQGKSKQERLPPLYLARRLNHPPLRLILGQVVLALLAIIWGAHGFVHAVQSVAVAKGIPVFVLSLIITPIATELPEKFNSVLWLRHGKDTLALGNISGAMVFQSSIIPALGILMTPWNLEYLALWSAILALAAALIPFYSILRRGVIYPSTLLYSGVYYLVFIFIVLRSPMGH